VAFLPEKFARVEKQLGVLELPSDNTVPLIQLERNALHQFRVVYTQMTNTGGFSISSTVQYTIHISNLL
jgi:hypothetical protein